MAENNKEFVNGLFGKIQPKQPDFVVCKLLIKREELLKWLETKDDEWINLDVTKRQGDEQKLNISVDTWKPTEKRSEGQNRDSSGMSDEEINPDEIPFN